MQHPSVRARGWRRRDVLRSAGAAALGGTVLAACASTKQAASSSASAAAPQVVNGVTHLIFQSNWQHLPWTKTSIQLVQQYADSTFNAQHPGVRATVDPSGWGGGSGLAVRDIAHSAGTPDVYMACCTDFWDFFAAAKDLLVPLNSYLSKDNIDTSIWNKGHLAANTYGGDIYGLPSYDGPIVMCYRQDILDQLGYAYPNPNWTYTEAADLWTKCAGTVGSKHRYGVAIRWLTSAEYLLRGFGGSTASPDLQTCTIDSPNSLKAAQWFYNLFDNKITTQENGASGIVGTSPTEVFSMCGGWELFNEATLLGSKYKWNILPVPTWPNGFSTFINHDAYFINGVTKNLDLAWELMKWLTVDPGWTKFQMRTTLIQPGITSLWDEWITVVKQVAPPLADKDIHYYRDAALSSGAWTHTFFRYDAGQVDNLLQNWVNEVNSGTYSVTEGFRLAAQQINAFETAQKGVTAQAQANTSLFPVKGQAIASVQPGL